MSRRSPAVLLAAAVLISGCDKSSEPTNEQLALCEGYYGFLASCEAQNGSDAPLTCVDTDWEGCEDSDQTAFEAYLSCRKDAGCDSVGDCAAELSGLTEGCTLPGEVQ